MHISQASRYAWIDFLLSDFRPVTREVTKLIMGGRLRRVLLDDQTKTRGWFVPAAMALVMLSGGSAGSLVQGGQGPPNSGASLQAGALFSTNLMAHWRFDEQRGTLAADSSGHGNHGILHDFPRHSSPWIAGRLGGGLSFKADGWTNNVVTVPDSASLNFTNGLSFTLAIWVKSRAKQIEAAGILCKGTGMGGEQYGVDICEGTYRFYTRPAKGGPSASASSAVAPSGRWQHLAATFDGQARVMAIYVDGQLANSQRSPDSLRYTTHEVSIGCRQSNETSAYNLPFSGLIDDVRIYDRALNANEVRSLYDSAGPWPLAICNQPKGASRHVGEEVVFDAEADGTGALEYQWQKNGQDVRDAITPRLELRNLRFEDAGVYTLKVMDLNGTITSANAVLTMAPYFWQSRWFLVLVVPLLLLSVAGMVYVVEKRKARQAVGRLERARAIDQERMRIARDMHDEIGSKLSRISLLSEMARQSVSEASAARKQIEEVSDAARDIVESVDEIVWAVNPRHDTLESLVNYIRGHAEEFFEMTTVELEFRQSDGFPVAQLSAETRHNVFCAVKEALNNALKHAAATRVGISFDLGESSFQITIADNGCGFAPQRASTAGNGLFNIRERLKSVQGACLIESQPGRGTKIVFTVPLNAAAQKVPTEV